METQSPESFLRSLKTSNNVELALSAWKSEDLYIPSKGQFLAAWALNALLKGNNATRDVRYWSLLESIILGSSSIPPWVSTLVYKTPVIPILTAMLHICAGEDGKELGKDVLEPCQRVMHAIIPIAYPKTRLDTMVDCFWACLDAIPSNSSQDGISELLKLGVEGFRVAFSNATNKGKIYINFVEAHFTSFTRAVLGMPESSQLRKLVWDAGHDILCSFEAIKIISQQRNSLNQGLFGRLLDTCVSLPSALDLCPAIFLDQLNAIKTHRLALSQANVELTAWQLYKCFISLFENLDTEQSAAAQMNTLSVVITQIVGGVREQAWSSILKGTTVQCIQKLSSQDGRDSNNLQNSLTGSLVILGQMNYEFLEPHLAEILGILCYHPSENESGRELYRVIISYHSKTRNMETLLKELFSIISQLHLGALQDEAGILTPPQVAKEGISNVLNGCILSREGGIDLATSLHQSTTPGQVPRIVDATLTILNNSWKSLQDGLESSQDSTLVSSQWQDAIAKLSLGIQLASVVLPHLPFTSTQAASKTQLNHWQDRISEGLVVPCLRITLDKGYMNNWSCQLLGKMVLHLISSLDRSALALDGSWALNLTGITFAGSLSPHNTNMTRELKLELARVLLRSSNLDTITIIIQDILDSLISSKSEVWDGRAIGMTAGNLNTGFTLLLTDRWLKLLETRATSEQLQQFASLVVLAYEHSTEQNSCEFISLRTSVHFLLKNGLFWELDRLQGAILSMLMKKTEIGDFSDGSWPNQIDAVPALDPATIEQLGRRFHFLLHFPYEAFKGGNSVILARRAILTDLAASICSARLSYPILEARTTCRLFASRFAHDTKSIFVDYIGNKNAVQFLVAAEPGISIYSKLEMTFLQATNILLDIAFSGMIRHTTNSKSAFQDLLSLFSSLKEISFDLVQPIYLDSLARLLYNLANWSQSTDVTDEQGATLRACVTQIQDIIRNFMLNSILERPALLPSSLKLLRACLRFNYMDPTSVKEAADNYITIALSTLTSARDMSDISRNALAEMMWIIIDVVDVAAGDFDIATKMISLHCLALAEYDVDLDVPLQHGAKKLDLRTYESLLKLLTEALQVNAKPHLIRTLTIALINSPEGTFKAGQSAFSESLSVLGDIKTTTDIEIQSSILTYALSICTEKPAFLRNSDIGSLFALLTSYLQPSASMGPQTHPDVFHSIVKVATALVRNRRDLVLLSLPHLAVIFCLLFTALTKALPNLGQRQRRNVSNRLPSWVSLSQPLGSQEAALVSRLMVTMTTKTVVRSTKTSLVPHDGKDAQSLAKPFGKHASCVMGSYVNLLNNPLVHLDRATRAELAPGLFALCKMLGEKGRDALMPILDSGGKMVFKNLWSSYETQKYVGKG